MLKVTPPPPPWLQIDFKVVSEAQPTSQQLEDIKFAWQCVKHVKSNAITVAKDGRLLGMGSGQPNRVKSVQIALEKAAEEVKVGWFCITLKARAHCVSRQVACGQALRRDARCQGIPPDIRPLDFCRDPCLQAMPSSPSAGTTRWRLHARLVSAPSCTPAAACGTRMPSTAATNTESCS